MAFRYVTACLLLAGCQTMASATGHPTGDTRHWQMHRVQVDDVVVEFAIPPGESKEFPNFPIPAKLDLSGLDSFDEIGLGPNLLRGFWDYSSSRFAQPEGTLSAVIAARKSSHEIIDLESLKLAVLETSRRFEEKAGVASEAQDLPKNYQQIKIGGRDVLRVTYKLSSPSHVFLLDKRNYLEVSFRVSDFTSKPNWRADAQAAADAILHSIRILPVH